MPGARKGEQNRFDDIPRGRALALGAFGRETPALSAGFGVIEIGRVNDKGADGRAVQHLGKAVRQSVLSPLGRVEGNGRRLQCGVGQAADRPYRDDVRPRRPVQQGGRS